MTVEISDDMVSEAVVVYGSALGMPGGRLRMRAALEAVAPAIYARALEEAAKVAETYKPEPIATRMLHPQDAIAAAIRSLKEPT